MEESKESLSEPLTDSQLQLLKENRTFKNISNQLSEMHRRLAKMENLLNGKVSRSIENILKDKLDSILKKYQI